MRSLHLCTPFALAALTLAACETPPPETPAKPIATTPPTAPPAPPVVVRLLAFNDFHGNIKPPGGHVPQVDGDVGGAGWFGAHLKALGAGKPDTIIVAAGDLIGASPLSSGLFHDEPTVEIMNAFGLSVTALGNHEFDEGTAELLRMKNGGCHPKDGCQFDPNFPGAKYDILGANVRSTKDNSLFMPAYVVREVSGIPIAFVGMPLAGTPRTVTPGGTAGLTFADEVATANALVPELRAKGIETMILLIHEGGEVEHPGLDECTDIKGPIVKIVENLDPAYDAVVSGHTHQLYNCIIAKRPVTSAYAFGRVITAIDLTIDPKTKDVIKSEAHNHAVTHDLPPDPAVMAIVDQAVKMAGPLENRIIGTITETLTSRRSGNHLSSGLGTVIADAELEATKKAGAKVALVNSSGIRGDILFGTKNGAEKTVDGQVTYGEAFATQPFGNELVTLTVNGADFTKLIERYINAGAPIEASDGFVAEFTTDGKHRTITEIKIGGAKISATSKVRLTTNSYLADHDAELKSGTDRTVGPGDMVAFESYFKAHPKIAPPKKPRFVEKAAK